MSSKSSNTKSSQVVAPLAKVEEAATIVNNGTVEGFTTLSRDGAPIPPISNEEANASLADAASVLAVASDISKDMTLEQMGAEIMALSARIDPIEASMDAPEYMELFRSYSERLAKIETFLKRHYGNQFAD